MAASEGSPDADAGAGPDTELEALAQDLAEVDAALARLDEGTYGSCEACGVRLSEAVLTSAPAARRCADHGGPSSASLG